LRAAFARLSSLHGRSGQTAHGGFAAEETAVKSSYPVSSRNGLQGEFPPPPFPDARQQELLTDLRAWSHSEYRPIADLQGAILEFVDDLTLVVIIDFDVNEEPALLVPAHSLAMSEKDLRTVYPDGFALIREEGALTVDFEEELGRMNVSYAAAH
jgi:hypothetical protein